MRRVGIFYDIKYDIDSIWPRTYVFYMSDSHF